MSKRSLAESSSSVVLFSKTFVRASKDLRLIEINDEIEKKLQKGITLKLIGSETHMDTVLCTDDKTYSIKKVETSNTVFFVPKSDLDNKFSIAASCNDYYELKPIVGRIDQLNDLLKSSQYSGKDDVYPSSSSANSISRQRLCELVQASDEEVNSALKSTGVFELNGNMRLVSKILLREVTRALVDTIIENGWPLDLIDENICRQAMNDSDHLLLNAALSQLGTRNDHTENKWKLSHHLIAQSTAHFLFNSIKTTSKVWEYNDFMHNWSMRTPGKSDDLSIEILEGIAISEGDGCGKVLIYCPFNEMTSLDAAERCQILFKLKPKLKIEEMKPYFADIFAAGKFKSTEEIVLANAKFVDGYYVQK